MKADNKQKEGRTGAIFAGAVPTTWLDSLLTGPNAVIGKPPFDCKDIERLLNAIRSRMEKLLLVDVRRPTRKEKDYGRSLAA